MMSEESNPAPSSASPASEGEAKPAPQPPAKKPDVPPDPSRNNSMRFVTKDVAPRVVRQFGADHVQLVEQHADDCLDVAPEVLVELCFFLRDEDDLAFDLCHCISSVDDGAAGTLTSVYHLNSLTKKQWIVLSVTVPKDKPEIPSVSCVWGAAEWHEREAWDLMGIVYTNHPDLRRILCAEEWQGHPLRKEYVQPEHETVKQWGL